MSYSIKCGPEPTSATHPTESVFKMFRVMEKIWKSILTIEDSKDLETTLIEELMGSL